MADVKLTYFTDPVMKKIISKHHEMKKYKIEYVNLEKGQWGWRAYSGKTFYQMLALGKRWMKSIGEDRFKVYVQSNNGDWNYIFTILINE